MGWGAFVGLAASLCSLAIGLYQIRTRQHHAGAMWFFVIFFVLLLICGYLITADRNGGLQVGPPQNPQDPKIKPTPNSPGLVGTTDNPNPGPEKHVANLPSPRVHRIMGLAYSYSKNQWAGSVFGGGLYPDVRLEFRAGLVGGYAPISWEGGYELTRGNICLTIKNLKIPNRSVLGEYYSDFGVGYGIELDNAVFGDYSIARIPILYRSFLGDSPPPLIEKCFKLVPIFPSKSEPFRIAGIWEGSDQGAGEIDHTMARIQQDGNRFYGTYLSAAEDGK